MKISRKDRELAALLCDIAASGVDEFADNYAAIALSLGKSPDAVAVRIAYATWFRLHAVWKFSANPLNDFRALEANCAAEIRDGFSPTAREIETVRL